MTMENQPTPQPAGSGAAACSALCFECEAGEYRKAIWSKYQTTLMDGSKMVIANVPVEACNRCGDIIIGLEGNRVIESAIEAAHPGYFRKPNVRDDQCHE